ncbi:hypothetical protein LXL04_017570 [Taraxacum kok-saghyz]
MWLFKHKLNGDGSLAHYKACLVGNDKILTNLLTKHKMLFFTVKLMRRFTFINPYISMTIGYRSCLQPSSFIKTSERLQGIILVVFPLHSESGLSIADATPTYLFITETPIQPSYFQRCMGLFTLPLP